MLVRMRLVDVVVPRAQAPDAVRRLHLAGAVHLVPFRLPAGDETGVFETGSPAAAPGAEPWRRRLDWLTELVATLGARDVPAALVAELWDLDDGALEARIAPLEPVQARATSLADERDALTADRARLEWFGQVLDSLVGTAGEFTVPPGYTAVAIVMDARDVHVIDLVEDELRGLAAGRCAVVRTPARRGRAAGILVFPGRLAGEVDAMLGGRRLDELALPPQLAGVPLSAVASRIERELVGLGERIERVEASLAELRDCHGALASAARLVVRDRLAEAETFRAAGASEHLVVFSGWLPADGIRRPAGRARRRVGRDRAPSHAGATRACAGRVSATNGPSGRSSRSRPFVGVPRYGSLDPTPLLAVAFPLFVGFMVGDAGYGLLLLALVVAARRRWRVVGAGRGRLAGRRDRRRVDDRVRSALRRVVRRRRARLRRDAHLARPSALPSEDLLVLAVGDRGCAGGPGARPRRGQRRCRLGDRREVASRLAELVCLAGVVAALGASAGFVPAVAGQLAGVVLAVGLLALVASRGSSPRSSCWGSSATC